ncbi:hypothetical protein DY000_02039439 [Brassica cretica]|uniref:Uncharacterized protein n=1 Tax=Brassica cretica TaxID=69181 RepID=A0ABQ7BCH0_BRACR|nr:hypothetical protein DY000_02039439 [Brassica cretica]
MCFLHKKTCKSALVPAPEASLFSSSARLIFAHLSLLHPLRLVVVSVTRGYIGLDWYGVLPRCLGDSRPLSRHLRASEVSINSKVSLANGASMCQFRRWWHLETCCVALLRRLWLRRCNACGLPLTYFLLFPVLVLLVPLQKPTLVLRPSVLGGDDWRCL